MSKPYSLAHTCAYRQALAEPWSCLSRSSVSFAHGPDQLEQALEFERVCRKVKDLVTVSTAPPPSDEDRH